MNNLIKLWCIIGIGTFPVLSCTHNEDVLQKNEEVSVTEISCKKRPLHPYGGWSCPDNIYGFPPVDIAEWDKVPVVNDRLPTKEETMNGTSLMYFDTNELPDAKPIDMKMPRLARYYSDFTGKNELVIVIQAVEAKGDSVVGFRYLNGGNGSAWFDQVDFMEDKTSKAFNSAPFVSLSTSIEASNIDVWDAITNPVFNLQRNQPFEGKNLIETTWLKGENVEYLFAPNSFTKYGKITSLWENLYIQMDYNFDGQHYVQKVLMLKNPDTGMTDLNVISGPHATEFSKHYKHWENWMNTIKEISEEG